MHQYQLSVVPLSPQVHDHMTILVRPVSQPPTWGIEPPGGALAHVYGRVDDGEGHGDGGHGLKNGPLGDELWAGKGGCVRVWVGAREKGWIWAREWV